jgi:hypothetical protein
MYNQERPTFNVSEPFLGVTTVQLNRAMVDLLINVLNDQEGQLEKEVWALVRALNDPAGCREARAQRKRLTRPIRPKYERYADYDEYGENIENDSMNEPESQPE